MRFRNLASGVQLVILVGSALFIVLFGYLLLRAYHHRFDLSPGSVYSLAPQTIQILEAMKSEPIQVSAFFRDDAPAKWNAQNLFKEYAFRHPRFRYRFYDPDRMPAKAKQYQIEAYDTIVIEASGRQERTKQVTEEAITNLLAKLMRGEMKRITFAVGHGGYELSEQEAKTGYGFLRQKLTESNYEVKETVLLRDRISKGTDLLVLAGPRVDLLLDEFNLIRDYWESGGSLLMLIDPYESGEGKRLKEFLLAFGVQIEDDVIVDKLSKLFGADYLIPLITDYKPHPMTTGFRLASFLPIARSVRKANPVPDGLDVTEIAWTGAGSWAETDLKDLAEGTAEFNQKKDQAGPIPLAVAVHQKEGKSRLVIFGDSDFVSNGYLKLSGNQDLFLNAVAWLAGDDLAVTIRPRARDATPLYLKETDQTFLFYGPVLGLPMLSLLTGTAVFIWRRKFH